MKILLKVIFIYSIAFIIHWRYHINFSLVVSFLRLGRFHFVSFGFFLYLFGSCLAFVSGNSFEVNRFILGYMIVFIAQLSVSYSNDYFDVEADCYTKKTLFSGGSKVLIEHPELRRFSKWFAISLIILSIVLAVVSIMIFSLHLLFLIFVIVGNIVGWFYSAPPLRFVYRGLGEIIMMLTIGFFLPGLAYWINGGSFDGLYLLFVFPLMVYGLGFILNVEIPDKEADTQARKKTFIVKKGKSLGFLVIGFIFFCVSLYFVLIYLYFRQEFVIDFRIVTLISLLPLAIGLRGVIKRNESRFAEHLALMNLLSLLLLIIFCDVYFVGIILA